MDPLSDIVTDDGEVVRVRFLEREDGPLLIGLFYRLSPESRYQRFHVPVHDLTDVELHDYLPPYLDVDRTHHVALVGLVEQDGEQMAVAVARFKQQDRTDEAEVAIVVQDDWQRRGVGRAFMMRLILVARSVGIRRLIGWVNPSNRAVSRLLAAQGYPVEHHLCHGEDQVVMTIAQSPD